MTRVALYARYSSDSQRDASIEDQLRLCSEYAQKQGWRVVDTYFDRAVSGDTLLRDGILETRAIPLIANAMPPSRTSFGCAANMRKSRDGRWWTPTSIARCQEIPCCGTVSWR